MADASSAAAASAPVQTVRTEVSFPAFNALWEAWVDRENPPARTTVEARLAGERYLVEIMVVAARR